MNAKIGKRILAIVLTLGLTLSMLPTTAFAAAGQSDGAAPLAKNFAPYSSQAIAIPMAFFAIAIGLYPTSPSNPSPGI